MTGTEIRTTSVSVDDHDQVEVTSGELTAMPEVQ